MNRVSWVQNKARDISTFYTFYGQPPDVSPGDVIYTTQETCHGLCLQDQHYFSGEHILFVDYIAMKPYESIIVDDWTDFSSLKELVDLDMSHKIYGTVNIS